MFAPPNLGDSHSHDSIRLADWVELNLLTGEEQFVSIASVADELASDPPDRSRDSESWNEYEDASGGNGSPTGIGFRDTAEEKAEAAFRELSWRSSRLENRYPIKLDGEVALLRQDGAAYEVCRFLVLLRGRQMYKGVVEDDGSESGFLFEELVKFAMGKYVGAAPEHQVRFGVAGGSRGDGLPETLEDAVRELSRRMFENPGEVPVGGKGDYKADAIAWRPFGDQRPGQLVLIGQATISEGEWTEDELPKKWTDRRLIRFLARPLTAVAFPETLSLTPPDRLNGMRLSSIPFDRLRLMSVLRDDDLPGYLRDRIEDWSRGIREKLPR